MGVAFSKSSPRLDAYTRTHPDARANTHTHIHTHVRTHTHIRTYIHTHACTSFISTLYTTCSNNKSLQHMFAVSVALNVYIARLGVKFESAFSRQTETKCTKLIATAYFLCIFNSTTPLWGTRGYFTRIFC